jgi:hypothetical protein
MADTPTTDTPTDPAADPAPDLAPPTELATQTESTAPETAPDPAVPPMNAPADEVSTPEAQLRYDSDTHMAHLRTLAAEILAAIPDNVTVTGDGNKLTLSIAGVSLSFLVTATAGDVSFDEQYPQSEEEVRAAFGQGYSGREAGREAQPSPA